MRTPPLNIQDREFLIWLRESATRMTSCNLNPSWNRAYLALADAADRLDAMQARNEVPSYMQGKSLEIGTEAGWAPEECTAPDCDCDQSSGCHSPNYPITRTTNNL